ALAATSILLISGLSIENFLGHAGVFTGLNAINISHCQIEAYQTHAGGFNFTNCNRGVIGGLSTIRSGTTPYLAKFTNCNDWVILNSLLTDWVGLEYQFTNCTNMKKSAATVAV